MQETIKKQHILVVDDALPTLALMKKLLSSDYRITTAETGREALQTVAANDLPDLILLDVMMPGMDGYEVCRKLKGDFRTRHIPVIFLTANEEGKESVKGFEVGALDFITKPFHPAILKARINNQLDLKSHRDSLGIQVNERNAALAASNEKLQQEIKERKKAQEALQKANEDLERNVEKRTADLLKANQCLEREIEEHRRTEKALRESDLKYKKLNTALEKGLTDVFEAMTQLSTGNPEVRISEKSAINLVSRLKRSVNVMAENLEEIVTLSHEFAIGLAEHFDVLHKVSNGELQARVRGNSQVELLESLKQVTNHTIESISKQIAERNRAEDALRENETYLKTIMETIEAGILITDPETGKIIDANRFASQLVGCPTGALVRRKTKEFMRFDEAHGTTESENYKDLGAHDGLLLSDTGKSIQVRRSTTNILLKQKEYLLQSFHDVTDIKNLLRKQELNVALAAKLLQLTNGKPPRSIDFLRGLSMFVCGISIPCYTVGGDHYFVRPLSQKGAVTPARTILSLKDQSGHEVRSVLKGIMTDLIHNAIFAKDPSMSIEDSVALLNEQIFASGIFEDEDFCTSMNVEIDHETLNLRYVSTGHPPFLLIRDHEVFALPVRGTPGANVPLGFKKGMTFTVGDVTLKRGDRLLFYSDGLTEMPLARMERKISTDDLIALVHEIMGQEKNTISDISNALLNIVADLSGEQVKTFFKNTSNDDVTLLGVEIEDADSTQQRRIKPANMEQLSTAIEDVCNELESLWHQHGFHAPEQRMGPFLEEAMLNAWHHGNGRDPSKEIIVRWRFGNDFRLEIVDEGEGFDHGSAPDPKTIKNRLKSSGRGIFIMKRIADALEWKRGGRHLVACFCRYPNKKERKHHGALEDLMPLWSDNSWRYPVITPNR